MLRMMVHEWPRRLRRAIEVPSVVWRQVAGYLAPGVCPACDEGSGLHLDETRSKLVVCTVCNGTGRERLGLTNTQATSVLARALRLRRARRDSTHPPFAA